jgi:hypothetical protein
VPPPCRAGTPATEQFAIRCTPAELAALRAWAAGQGLTLADAARLAILDAAAEAGEVLALVPSTASSARRDPTGAGRVGSSPEGGRLVTRSAPSVRG